VAREHDRSERRHRRALTRVAGERSCEACGDSGARRIDNGEVVIALLSQLRPPVRDVLLLVGGFGLSYVEAATALGIPLGTVASRMSTGRRQLKRLLGASETAGMARRRWKQ
jgi:RNA polymerase sigma-70 factor (ECF subfamily)